MDDGLGSIAVALLVLFFVVAIAWAILSAVLVGVLYLFCGLYLGLQFLAVNFFAVMDAIFYFHPAVPPLPSWMLGGALFGIVVQGLREISLRENRTLPVILLCLPILLLLVITFL